MARYDHVEGKTVVVTGANGGIGYETCKGLAERGAEIVMVCRDKAAGTAALDDLKKAVPGVTASLELVDLGDKGSIKAFGKRWGKRPLHVLVNNAGLWSRSRRTNKEGLELTFAVNHLGYYRMTHALLPAIEKTPGARIVNVASTAHHFARVDWDDLQMEERFNGEVQYSNTKLYNIWFTVALAERLRDKGITVNSVHPGTGGTGLTRDFPQWIERMWRPFGKKAATLAYSSIRAASDPELEGVTGKHLYRNRAAHRSAKAKNLVSAERMYQITEEMA